MSKTANLKDLRAGDNHYKAYIGPPHKYDLVGALQFNLLTSCGLRDYHKLLDIGCGSLRAGKLFIPFLRKNNYYGIEPNKWLLEKGIENELGNDILSTKSPSFSYSSEFDLQSFGLKFDFIIAQSIFSHASSDQINTCLQEVKLTLKDEGFFLATFLVGENNYTGKDWVYPESVTYKHKFILKLAEEHQLSTVQIKWRHLNQQSWYLFFHPENKAAADQVLSNLFEVNRRNFSLKKEIRKLKFINNRFTRKVYRTLKKSYVVASRPKIFFRKLQKAFWKFVVLQKMNSDVPFEYELLNLDYLVFSSHKTATQTIAHTLRRNGYYCRHCHQLPHIDLKTGDLREYLEWYLKLNNRKLNVITVFRDPLSRKISSFFQRHGSVPLRLNKVANEYETIIYRYSTEQLIEKFISELNDRPSLGLSESIYDICRELNLEIEDLTYNPNKQLGVFETDLMKLYILRFDSFIKNIKPLLSDITGSAIEIKTANMTEEKWYNDIYKEFKSNLSLPHQTISEFYHSKRDLIDLLYPDDYEALLNQAIVKYG